LGNTANPPVSQVISKLLVCYYFGRTLGLMSVCTETMAMPTFPLARALKLGNYWPGKGLPTGSCRGQGFQQVKISLGSKSI